MTNQEHVLLDHGSGGLQSGNLIAGMMLPAFDNVILSRLEDGATVELNGGRVAFTTDSYVVDPIFFPGGSIGDLAVNGTVNDIAMCGGKPQYLSVGLIIEEGFALADLRAVVNDMARAARTAGVQVVTGDTKVVSHGSADKIFINTAGLGIIAPGVDISAAHVRPGDQILLSGCIADHGVTILSQRAGFSFESPVTSDSAPLNRMVARMLDNSPGGIHALRDPTRGGVATVLNEIAARSETGIRIREESIPVKPSVAGLCELLGLDPLYVANEGKLLAFVDPGQAEGVLAAMRADPHGRDATVIGEVVSDHPGRVAMATTIGGERLVDMPSGEQLPRIC